jgi:CBS domain-containing protein
MPGSLAARPVGEIMSRTPATLTGGEMVGELLTLFEKEQINAIPVVDSEGFLCGIVTPLDLLRALRPDPTLRAPRRGAALLRTVETIMRPGVYTLEPADPLAAAIDLMLETRFHVLPVVRRDPRGPVLVGVVRQRDLVSALLRPQAGRPAERSRRAVKRGSRDR